MGLFSDSVKTWRVSCWWRWKIPPLLGAALAQALLLGTAPAELLRLYFLAAVFCVGQAAAFGYAINEWADGKSDELAQKPNSMAGLKLRSRAFSVLLPLLAGGGAALAGGFGPAANTVLALEFFLVAAYSLYPLRLKERGVWGVMADALSSGFLPGLFIVLAFSRKAPDIPLRAVIFDVFLLTQLLAAGIKGILTHQDLDRENDRAAGVATFALSTGPAALRRILVKICYPVELFAIIGMVISIYPVAPLVLPVFILYSLMEISKIGMNWRVAAGSGQAPYLPFYNNFFQELAWPLTLAFSASLAHPALSILPIFQVIFFYKNIPAQTEEFLRLDSAYKNRLSEWMEARSRREIEAEDKKNRPWEKP